MSRYYRAFPRRASIRHSSPVAGGGSFDYYISPAGSNSNDGLTTSTPWAITALASKSAIAGKRVGLMDGTYTATGSGGLDGTAILWPCNYGGTLANPTIIEAVNARAAIFDGLIGGSGSQYTEQNILGTEQNYVQFKNLVLHRAKQKLIYLGGNNGLVEGCVLYDLDNARSSDINGPNPSGDNCEPVFIQGPGTGAGQRNSGNVIRNCRMYDVYNQVSGSINATGVKIYDSENNVIENCEFYNMGRAVYEKSNSAGTIFRKNFAHDMYQMTEGIGSRYANGTWQGTPSAYTPAIYQNLGLNLQEFVDNTADDIAQTLSVYNNTFRSANASITGISIFRGSLTGRLSFHSNIQVVAGGVGSGYGHLYFSDTDQVATLCDYNVYRNSLKWNAGNRGGSPYSSLASWQASGGGFDSHSITSDPSFVNDGGTSAADYKLNGGSPALTAGQSGGPCGCYITGSETIGADF